MIVETQTGKTDWAPKARRQGERPDWNQKPRAAADGNAEKAGAAPPPSQPARWPRVFPGL